MLFILKIPLLDDLVVRAFFLDFIKRLVQSIEEIVIRLAGMIASSQMPAAHQHA